MGWASGSELLGNIAEAMERLGTPTQRVPIYRKIVEAFADMDCDTMDECMGADPALDVVLLEDEIKSMVRWREDPADIAERKAALAALKKAMS